MALPEEDIQERIDALTKSNISFALYRTPWADECHLIMQTEGKVLQLGSPKELNGKKGFVIAPFKVSDTHPLVLIHPDITASGWEEIGQIAAQLSADTETEGAEGAEIECEDSKDIDGLKNDRGTYEKVFRKFMDSLQRNEFQKLVLSRKAARKLPRNFSPTKVFCDACSHYPRMFIYLCHTPITGTWTGSTPEALLQGSAEEWRTVALAGTQPIKDEVIPEQWSIKNRKEQQMVTDYIRNILNKFGRDIQEKGPYTARAGQLVHLKTDFSCKLKDAGQVGELLEALHPTPAVCGLPKDRTYAFIPAQEGYDRRYYSGFIGKLDPEHETDLYVNLRCMELDGKEAVLYAGGGILPSSTCRMEWEETIHKMETMNRLF